jgi:hypothetical protein
MIRLFLFSLFLYGAVSSRAQTAGVPARTTTVPAHAPTTVPAHAPTIADDTKVLSVNDATHNFGSIPQGKPVTYQYVLVNHTRDTITMQHVEASCGCTTPRWNKAPVPPGDSTLLPVTYNAAGDGGFQKSITIFYTNNLRQLLYIRGDVWKTPDTSVPLNIGIQLVKQ